MKRGIIFTFSLLLGLSLALPIDKHSSAEKEGIPTIDILCSQFGRNCKSTAITKAQGPKAAKQTEATIGSRQSDIDLMKEQLTKTRAFTDVQKMPHENKGAQQLKELATDEQSQEDFINLNNALRDFLTGLPGKQKVETHGLSSAVLNTPRTAFRNYPTLLKKLIGSWGKFNMKTQLVNDQEIALKEFTTGVSNNDKATAQILPLLIPAGVALKVLGGAALQVIGAALGTAIVDFTKSPRETTDPENLEKQTLMLKTQVTDDEEKDVDYWNTVKCVMIGECQTHDQSVKTKLSQMVKTQLSQMVKTQLSQLQSKVVVRDDLSTVGLTWEIMKCLVTGYGCSGPKDIRNAIDFLPMVPKKPGYKSD